MTAFVSLVFRRMPRHFGAHGIVVVTVSALLLAAGCSSGPKAIPKPEWDPEGMADKGMSEYDTDGNGQLDEKELAAAPGLLYGLELIDTNGDAMISRDELRDRILFFEEKGTGLQQVNVTVTMDGNPLQNAEIVFEPETLVAGVVQPATGTTDFTGTAAMTGDVPDSVPGTAQNGIYRVRITTQSGKKVPEKYNTKTELGIQVSTDNELGQLAGTYRFDLKSR